MIDKDKIKSAAQGYCDATYGTLDDHPLIAEAFRQGANWAINEFLRNLWHAPEEEPTYHPFKDAEECWQEMQKHQPFGWLKDKNDGHLTLITVVDNDKMMALNGRVGWDFLSMMNNYVFADGTPFGVKEEE